MRAGRAGLACALALLAGATVLAQRGRFGPGDYSMAVPYDGRFVFVRMSYPVGFSAGLGFGRGRGDTPWAHDYPTGEQHFMQILTTVSNVSGTGDCSVFVCGESAVWWRS